MTLSQLYQAVVKFGISRDPRRGKRITGYPDTALLYGSPRTRIKKILVGIDIEAPELLLADRLRSRQGLDLVIAHHPEGKALLELFKVMQLQVDMLAKLGVKRRVAQALLEERQREVERKLLPGNHMRSVDAARLLDMPFMCAHTPADNHVAHFLQQLVDKKRPRTVQELLDLLGKIPEYLEAARNGAGPRVIAGSPGRKTGKIFVEMTGGTEGSKEAFVPLRNAGVRTLVGMHLSEEHLKKVKETSLNVVIAGHISSDTLGLNLLLDRVEHLAGMSFDTIAVSGFRRIRRVHPQ